ncbi:hypothetical protein NDU88_003607 [Pleurodeles waltl]|uniref:Uncharacterized protein n=1 Tax=Pleurodeles waltl TaxID=8319 RepID=A0AAV7SGF4_PLEWA|nr:hypothetical protein NDU88_003607 [Pleurodeles waltl]
MTSKDEPIRQQFEWFYSDLYSAEGVDHKGVEYYLETSPVVRLPPLYISTLENDITPAEVLAAIHRLQPGKALGADGSGAEFYLCLDDSVNLKLYSYSLHVFAERDRHDEILGICEVPSKRDYCGPGNYSPGSCSCWKQLDVLGKVSAGMATDLRRHTRNY